MPNSNWEGNSAQAKILPQTNRNFTAFQGLPSSGGEGQGEGDSNYGKH